MSLYQQWIEESFNPFILFDAHGKALTVNTAAQFLLGHTNIEDLFTLATSYAATTFGFKRTHLHLEYGRFKFFAIEVGYDSEESIGIMLYKIPTEDTPFLEVQNKQHALTNIYTLIDLCISTNSISNNMTFIKELDPSFPDVRLDSNSFIKYLNLLFTETQSASEFEIYLRLKTGEHVRIENKKYSMFEFSITSNGHFPTHMHHYLQGHADTLGATFSVSNKKFTLEMILFT